MALPTPSFRNVHLLVSKQRLTRRLARRMELERLEDRLTPATLTPNQNFLAHTYLTLFNRPIDAVGLLAWGNLLNQGVSRTQVVLDMEGSLEFRINLIESMYHVFLDRDAEPAGLNSWVQFLGNGATENQLAVGILSSAEYFQNHGGTNDGFLDGVYHDLQLGLPISLGVVDPLSRQAWDQVFASGASRTTVAGLLFDGTQSLRNEVDARYEHLLNRDADPGGLAFWADFARQNGLGAVTAGIVGSDEYFNDAQLSVITLTPIVAFFTPGIGAAGTSVTIIGSGFSSASTVLFNNVPASFSIQSDTRMVATAPAGVTTGPITVTNAFGTASSTADFGVAPTLTSIAPAAAPVGSQVIITGTNFTHTSEVTFNGAAASSFAVDATGTHITVAVPNSATTGPVVVTAPGGTITSPSNFTILPGITSFNPSFGNPGSSVTIQGTNLTTVTGVLFNNTPATFMITGPTSITATVPFAASSGPITLQSAGGNTSSTTSFTVNVSSAPMITGVNPASAPIGTAVIISGNNFTGATSVTFNGTPAPGFMVTDNQHISVTVPAGATTGLISVVTPNGSASSAAAFVVSPAGAPILTSVTPTSGPVGTTVTIGGVNFTGATQVLFNTTAASFSVNGAGTQITATVPAGATTGVITVTGAGGAQGISSTFVVSPLITGFSVSSGTVGTSVTINGSNFTGVSMVTFNGVSAAIGTVTANSISVTVPAGATTGPVQVFTPNGNVTSSTSFTVLQPPQISSALNTATSQPFGQPGDTVTITGVHFTGATSVSFNGTSAAFTVLNDTTIRATIPNTATTGAITVTTPMGTGMSGSFGIAPTITNVPTEGEVNTSVTISGRNFTGATAVFFSGMSVGFTVLNDGQISATVPYVVAGPITVVSNFGMGTSSTFTAYVIDTDGDFGPVGGHETVAQDQEPGDQELND